MTDLFLCCGRDFISLLCVRVYCIFSTLPLDVENTVTRTQSLKAAGTHSQCHSDGKYHEQMRDVAKFWKSKGVCLAMLGLESEAAPNRFMPLRVLSYDGGAYRDQLSEAGARGGKKRKRKGIMMIMCQVKGRRDIFVKFCK